MFTFKMVLPDTSVMGAWESELTIRIGAFDPLIVSLPCKLNAFCLQNKTTGAVSVSVQAMPYGTHSVTVIQTINHTPVASSPKILFDLLPHSTTRQPQRDSLNHHEDTVSFAAVSESCAQNGVKIESVAIISSLADGLNGQSILLLKLATHLSRKKIKVKWIACDENSPKANDETSAEVSLLKTFNIEYVQAIMKMDPALFEYFGQSLPNVVSSFKGSDQGDGNASELPEEIRKLMNDTIFPVVEAVRTLDVVHFTTRALRRWEDELLLYAVREAGVSVVLAEPGNVENGIVSGADAFVVPSRFLQRHLNHILPEVPTHILPPSIDEHNFRPFWSTDEEGGSPDEKKKRKTKSEGLLNIAFIGRLTSLKSPGIFISVAAIIKDAWEKAQRGIGYSSTNLPRLKFSMIGVGDLLESLRSASKRMELDITFMHIPNKNMSSFLSLNVDLVLHTTVSNESFGYSNLEAMASEVPVVTFGVGGVEEYLSANSEAPKVGVVVPPGNINEMAFATLNLLSNDFERRSMGMRARKYVMRPDSPYQKQRVSDRYIRITSGILCQKLQASLPFGEMEQFAYSEFPLMVAHFSKDNPSDVQLMPSARAFRDFRALHLIQRGDHFGGGEAVSNPLGFLRNHNSSFQNVTDFYDNDWVLLREKYKNVAMPHPITGGNLTPWAWERRGNRFLTSPHKLAHDIEQLKYLVSIGRIPSEFQKLLIQPYEAVLREVVLALQSSASQHSDENIDVALYALKRNQLKRLWTAYNANIHIYPGRLTSKHTHGYKLINPHLNFAQLGLEYTEQFDPVVIVDDFFTPGALDFLYNYFLESTFWYTVKHGYVGAHHDDGMAHPVLEQLVEEIKQRFPRIVKDYPLVNLWAYKSSQDHHGIPVHSDDSMVSFNIWITPNRANLDPDLSGLVIHRSRHPTDWDFAAGNELDKISNIQQYVRRDGAPASIKIPYRSNRVVIFDSTLFHETDTTKFRKGYRNRRINLSVLFGLKKNNT